MLAKVITLALFLTVLMPGNEADPKGLPLKPERTIEFATDEGTWVSLDVSPDGKTIVFELLGDIYTIPSEGGAANPVLTGLAMETQPRFSPDGKRIVFLSDRDGSENVWTAAIDGSDRRKVSRDRRSEFRSPSWSPDGEYILVSRVDVPFRAAEIWMYHRSGGSGVQVTKSKERPDAPQTEWNNDVGPVLSPDGKHLYFARRKAVFIPDLKLPIWQIVRRNLVTNDEDTITSAPGSAFSPRISPDGKVMVYGTRFEDQTVFKVRDLASGDERWLAARISRDDQEANPTRDLIPGYAFTPDSHAIIASYGGRIRRIPTSDKSDPVTIPFRAAVKLDLGPRLEFKSRVEDSDQVQARLMMGPTISPDGTRVGFSAFGRLFVANADGANLHRVTQSREWEFQPAWSPDGKRIAYVTWTAGKGRIWIAEADGSRPPQAVPTASAYFRDPVFSQDGRYLYALRGPAHTRLEIEDEWANAQSGLDLVEISPQTGTMRIVLQSRGLGRPHFGPEPDRIYVYSPQGLQSMRLDGSDRRVHLKIATPDIFEGFAPPSLWLRDARISPRGDRALAVISRQLWMVPIPRTGAEVPIDVSNTALPVRKLTAAGVDYFGWNRDGSEVFVSNGTTIRRIRLSDAELQLFDPGKKTEVPPGAETEFRVEVPRYKPRGVILLRGPRAITMQGNKVIEDADIVITNNRITAVGKRGAVPVPLGAKVFDLRGHTVIPGLVDVHSHWVEVRRGVLDTQSWPMIASLAYGVTTGRDPQTMTNDMFAYQDLIEAGEVTGPRAYSTGPGIFADSDFQDADDARNAVMQYTKYYRTNTLKAYMVGSRQQRQWTVSACRELEVLPTTEGSLDLKLDITHAIDGFSGNEHALPTFPLYKDVVELFAKSGIRYTPTLVVSYGGPSGENAFYAEKDLYGDPKLRRFIPRSILYVRSARRMSFQPREHVYSQLAREAEKISAAGGSVTVGGHGQLQGLSTHWEMWALASGGMTNHDVLRAATLRGAETIGLDADLGSIEAGKLADLVILRSDPLTNIRNTESIRFVMKGGKMFDGETMDEVWPEKTKLEPLWWWTDRP